MRPTWAEIRLDTIVDNFQQVKSLLPAEVKVLAAIKADAYGHGAIPIARALSQAGIDWLGVAIPEEGVQLRQAGIHTPILCLGGFWQKEQARECVNYQITPVLYRQDMLATLAEVTLAPRKPLEYHLKVDTGINRLGLSPNELNNFLAQAQSYPQLKLDGLLTHLASADEMAKDDFTATQILRFQQIAQLVRQQGFEPHYYHLANSAGVQAWPSAYGNLVRVGGLLYGFQDTLNPRAPIPPIKPVLSLHSRIILLKSVPANTPLGYGNTFYTRQESLIATLPIGYEDGWRRALSNRGKVLVRGCYAPIVGRVSMDLTLIDVTEVPAVSLGDEVLLIGASQGQQIRAEEVAALTDTISYEVTCALTTRVTRVYRQSD
jgi:alanine racemase